MKRLDAVFLDRDGTLDPAENFTPPFEMDLKGGATKAIEILKEHNIPIYSFTNQSCIARGDFTAKDFNKELMQLGFNDVYLCPHGFYDGCDCRKPEIGMLTKASADHDLKLEHCVVIGDSWGDMLAGAIIILVKTGNGGLSLGRYREKWADVVPNYIADDILDAIGWITNNYLT